jgi:hypothetical protein
MAEILYKQNHRALGKEPGKKPSSVLHNNNIPEVGIPMLGNKN